MKIYIVSMQKWQHSVCMSLQIHVPHTVRCLEASAAACMRFVGTGNFTVFIDRPGCLLNSFSSQGYEGPLYTRPGGMINTPSRSRVYPRGPRNFMQSIYGVGFDLEILVPGSDI